MQFNRTMTLSVLIITLLLVMLCSTQRTLNLLIGNSSVVTQMSLSDIPQESSGIEASESSCDISKKSLTSSMISNIDDSSGFIMSLLIILLPLLTLSSNRFNYRIYLQSYSTPKIHIQFCTFKE